MNFVVARSKQGPLRRNNKDLRVQIMIKHLLIETRHVAFVVLSLLSLGVPARSQNVGPNIRVDVDLVQLNVAVTDGKGNYVTGLHARDFVVLEDRVAQKLATFAEGDAPARAVSEINAAAATPPRSCGSASAR